ncbi:hypothetical protein CBR_g12745 [Chara braunii]|uniref:Integrase catalytic domain-containing protein n=1 Tax=Chara braunii TaxID=69332 RepID=A0A388KSK5_CHABU|nr:hypothetical protein CBR_g12745 [Chara braunii]|eukprot:GBG73026.1 hypothetical protein CBR_g12745 [Chara braunii]
MGCHNDRTQVPNDNYLEDERVKEMVRACYEDGILPANIDGGTMEVNGREVTFVLNSTIDELKVEWLKARTVTVIFRDGARFLPRRVKEDVIRAYEDGWIRDDAFGADFKRERIKVESPNVASYIPRAQVVTDWMLLKKSDFIDLAGTMYHTKFKPWMTRAEVRDWRKTIDENIFWVVAVGVPLDEMVFLRDYVERAIGRIVKAHLPEADEMDPKLVNLRFDIDPSRKEHMKDKIWVKTCQGDLMEVDLEKSEFFLSEISFLGYIVTVDGLKPDPRKVAAVQDAPAPVTLTQVRGFVGLASYYRRFIKRFAGIAKPFTNLLKKEEQLIRMPECEAAFQALKRALTSAPVLAHPDPTRPFALHTDWQPQAISAMLTQHGANGREHVIEYASKTLSPAQANYEACKGECLAVVWGIQHFRPYLYDQKFMLRVTERAQEYRWQGPTLQKQKVDDDGGSSWLTVLHPLAKFDWTGAAHEEDAVHFAVKYTEKAIEKNGWYWSRIREDVKYTVQNYPACAADKAPVQMPRTMVPTRVERPFQRVSIDTTDINVPRGPVDQGELNVLLVAVDHFSKWIEAYPMSSRNSQEVALYVNRFLCMHLDVEEVHMDNGSEFQGEP